METISLIHDIVHNYVIGVFALDSTSSVIEAMDHIKQGATKIMWAAEYYTCSLFHKLAWTESLVDKFKTKVVPPRRDNVNAYLSGINLMNMVLDLRKKGGKTLLLQKPPQISTHLLNFTFYGSSLPKCRG